MENSGVLGLRLGWIKLFSLRKFVSGAWMPLCCLARVESREKKGFHVVEVFDKSHYCKNSCDNFVTIVSQSMCLESRVQKPNEPCKLYSFLHVFSAWWFTKCPFFQHLREVIPHLEAEIWIRELDQQEFKHFALHRMKHWPSSREKFCCVADQHVLYVSLCNVTCFVFSCFFRSGLIR